MNLLKHLEKDNLHHAYLVEGDRNKVVPEILNFFEDLNVKTSGNPDFCNIVIDNFKMEEALNLRSMGNEKGFSSSKKIFIVCSNSFTLDAQGTLLKMFEEPIYNTHFFVIVPDTNALLKTLVSRFYVISARQDLAEETKNAEKFISMSLNARINFLKDFLKEPENEEIQLNSVRAKSLKFLNALETLIHSKLVKNFSGFTLPGVPVGTHTVQNSLQACCEHFFKVREFLRQPGSSTKSLMESVAIIIPHI